jgi:hypothetical protein
MMAKIYLKELRNIQISFLVTGNFTRFINYQMRRWGILQMGFEDGLIRFALLLKRRLVAPKIH